MTTPLRFAGVLVSMAASPVRGLHQLALQLLDDAGRTHTVYQCFGRGDGAQDAAAAAYADLRVGARYHGSATLQQVGTLATYWCGDVRVWRDVRRVHAPPGIAQPGDAQPDIVQPNHGLQRGAAC